MHEMNILSGSGDTTITWNPKNEKERETAQEAFEFYKKKGYAAFYAGWFSKSGRMESFDPKAKKVILVPPLEGG